MKRSVVFAVTGETLPEIEARAQSELDRFCGGLLPHVGRIDWDADIREVHRADKVSMYRAEVRVVVERGSGSHLPPATPDPVQHGERP